MTRFSFIDQLNAMRERGRRFFRVAVLPIALLAIAIVFWAWPALSSVRAARLRGERVLVTPELRRQMILSGSLLLAGYSLFVGLLWFAAWRYVTSTAPRCSHCGRRLTFRERDSVLASGTCPFCKTSLFNIEPAA